MWKRRHMGGFIHEHRDWPLFEWDFQALFPRIINIVNLQGKLVGHMSALGFELREEATLETMTLDIIKSTEIEGYALSADQVRSSIARRLGMNIAGLIPSDRDVDGVVDMMLDATQNYLEPLTQERLFNWHRSLFPTGKSGMYKITVGEYRDDSTGSMQVVSGSMGRERVHFRAPPSEKVQQEMLVFLQWFEDFEEDQAEYVLRAAIAHLWFLTIHPFEDGNGRIARALSDLVLSRSDGIPQRFYSMSAQIRAERKGYYDVLERTQRGTLDITEWLNWFFKCLWNALLSAEDILYKVLHKHQFWADHSKIPLNPRQIKMLYRLLDGFTGKLTSSKWAKITRCSSDTALRDIQDLISKNILRKEAAGGRSTNYELIEVPVDFFRDRLSPPAKS